MRVFACQSRLSRSRRRSGGRIDVRVAGLVLVLDPVPEPLGPCERAAWASSHRAYSSRGSCRCSGPKSGMWLWKRVKARPPGGETHPGAHQVDGATGQPGPVGPCLAVDQEGIGAAVEHIDQEQQFPAAWPARGTEREVEERDAAGLRGLDLGGIPWSLVDDPPRRFKIDSRRWSLISRASLVVGCAERITRPGSTTPTLPSSQGRMRSGPGTARPSATASRADRNRVRLIRRCGRGSRRGGVESGC